MRTRELRKLIEVEEECEFWGQTYKRTPAFVEAKLGNGKKLLGFQPLNTRPDYYVIRVDSRWEDMHDHINKVIAAIADEYGEMEQERENLEEDLIEQGIEPTGANTDLAGNEDRLGWPVCSLDSGYSWFELDWPS